MNLFLGTLLSWFYNNILTFFPSRLIRNCFLKLYLQSFDSDTSVQMRCRFLNGRKIRFGKRNVINFGCLLDGRIYPIEVGNDVAMGPEATILTLGHDPQSPLFGDKGGAVIIGNRVWIGYRATILPGITIGEGAVIGAGAVVTRDVEPFTIVAGIPAKPVGKRNQDVKYELKYRPFLT